MNEIINELRRQLIRSADEKTRSSSQRFFRESIQVYGVKMPEVKKISREYYKRLKEFDKEKIFDLCEILWQSGYLEESMVACNWTYALRKDFKPSDFKRFRMWIDSYVNNWATCDTFCNHSVGVFIEMYPAYLSELKRFAISKNRWMRRASAVSLIVPARKGLFLDSIFEISDSLLLDEDDIVQKGYGWMLKVASQYYQKEIFEYVIKNKAAMPRTALRYAIEKMPAELKIQAMKK